MRLGSLFHTSTRDMGSYCRAATLCALSAFSELQVTTTVIIFSNSTSRTPWDGATQVNSTGLNQYPQAFRMFLWVSKPREGILSSSALDFAEVSFQSIK